jgi:plastocyanin
MRLGHVLAVSCLLSGHAFGAELSGTAQTAGKPTQYAIVWLDAPNTPPLVQSPRVSIDQRNLDFAPHVVAIRVGTTVEFPNNDRVFHNVFSFRDGKKFDLGMYPAGAKSKPVIFDKPGLSRIFCNIHPHMAAYVMAVDTPYFAVSDARGGFSIAGVPAGTYTYHAWRPGGETLTGTVTVDATHPLDIKWP